MTHLSEDLLNEYLDGALAPESRAGVQTHLAACGMCSARLAQLRTLFASLDALPDLPGEVDFVPLILARLEQKAPLPRPLRWLTAAQAFGAILAAILAWPLLESAIQPVSLPSLSHMFAQSASSWLQTITDFQIPSFAFELPSLGLNLPSATLILTLVSVSLLWLMANGLLLIPHSRKTS